MLYSAADDDGDDGLIGGGAFVAARCVVVDVEILEIKSRAAARMMSLSSNISFARSAASEFTS